MPASPYLSIVVAARNDNYGGDFLGRFKLFAEGLARHNARHPGLFELVVTEWNPPAENGHLSEVFDWASVGQVRIVNVPHDLHMTVPADRRPPMFEYRAKNVGLRRSAGQFVLVTNADISFTDDFFNLVARRIFRPDQFYRADRHDFVADSSAPWPGRVVRINRRHDAVGSDISPRELPEDRNAWPSSGPFEGDIVLDEGRIVECHSEAGPMRGLHTNGSGDFILATPGAWEKAGAFWERTDLVAGLDGAMVHQLRRTGLRQTLLLRPYAIFHHEHSREEHNKLPKMPRPEITAMHRGILDGVVTGPFEQLDWGFAGVDLPETVFGTL